MTTITTTTTPSSSNAWARLEPIHDSGEALQPGFTQRPFLILNRAVSEVSLGRNHITGIDDVWVHRRLATLRLDHNGKVVLQLCPQKRGKHASSLTVNGAAPQWNVASSTTTTISADNDNNSDEVVVELPSLELLHGDIISIETRREPPLRYSYQLMQMTNTGLNDDLLTTTQPSLSIHQDILTAAGVADDDDDEEEIVAQQQQQQQTVIPSTQLSSACAEQMGNEVVCAVCMEIQVRSRSLVPCGHSFCQSCVTSPQPATCPVCRMPVTGQVPNLSVDSVIWKMVEASSTAAAAAAVIPTNPTITTITPPPASFFDMEDVQHYLKRSGKTLPTPPPIQAPVAIPPRPPQIPQPLQQQLQLLQQSHRASSSSRTAVAAATRRSKRRRCNAESISINPDQGTSMDNAICLD